MNGRVSIVSATFLLSLGACNCGGLEPDGAIAAREDTPVPARAEREEAGRAASESGSSKGFVTNIEAVTEDNQDYRRVLYTAKNLQLVVMAIAPGDHIGQEVHDGDQFVRVEEGRGEVVLDGVRTPIGPGSGIVVRSGTRHDFVNTGSTPLKVYSLYAPPEHRDGAVHKTHADADRDDEHYDGRTTP